VRWEGEETEGRSSVAVIVSGSIGVDGVG